MEGKKVSKINLSVIIPVYNAEKYLEECLDSILRQTCMPEKIILIDDGSTDKSGKICDQYSQEYAYVLVIHQKNQGVAASRKNGIKYVETKYVTFIDADDWIDVDLFEQMFLNTYSGNVDVVVTGIVYELENCQKKTAIGIPEGIYTRKEFHARFLSAYIYDYQNQKSGILPSLYAKLFRTSVIKQDLCDIDSRLTLGEDGAVVYPLLATAEQIVISSYCGYHYRRHEESRMTKISIMDFQQIKLLQEYLFWKLENIGFPKMEQQQIDYFLFASLKNLIRTIYGFEISEASIIFPCFDIPINSRIIVYGAGKVGMAYMRELLLYKQYSIVLWADQNKRGCCYGYRITAPEEILDIDYDFVLISIADADIAEKAKSDLSNMGVSSEKIIWFPVQWRQ